MKRIIALIIALFMIYSVAFADETDSFIAKWNSYSKHYGAPELKKEMLEDNVFTGRNWKIILDMVGDSYKGAGVYAQDMEAFFPLCAQTAIIIVGDYDSTSLRLFLGDLLYSFMSAKAGASAPLAVFGSYSFSIQKKESGYFFVMMGL